MVEAFLAVPHMAYMYQFGDPSVHQLCLQESQRHPHSVQLAPQPHAMVLVILGCDLACYLFLAQGC